MSSGQLFFPLADHGLGQSHICGRSRGLIVEAVLSVGPLMEQSWFEGRQRRSQSGAHPDDTGQCMECSIFTVRRGQDDLHGTANRRASCRSDRRPCVRHRLCGRRIAANFTPTNWHVFPTASQALHLFEHVLNSVAILPNYSYAWELEVLHSYETHSPINL